MKKLLTVALLFLVFILNAQTVNVITYNIRFNNPNDGVNAWPNRSAMVIGLLRFHDTGIFGLQEALIGQINDIKEQLPQMNFVGAGRDDGNKAGEFSPIFYDTTRFGLLDKGWFWLSETPEKPGLGWDAKYNRICTWAKLQDNNGTRFLVFNTHLDNLGRVARTESTKLIIQKIKDMNTDNLSVILMGDFNSTPDSTPVQYVTKFLKDSKTISKQPPYGPDGTFNNFDINNKLTDRIDYIFVNEKVAVLKYAVLSDSENDRYPSDHLPVFARVIVN